MNKIEHLGIAVKALDSANEIFGALFDQKPYKTEAVEAEGVSTAFYQMGESKIELLEATSPDSAIAKFIEKRGEGLHHIAFEVDDIRASMQRLKEQGFTLTRDEPFKGADNKWVCFVHPKTANGVLVELCQEIENDD